MKGVSLPALCLPGSMLAHLLVSVKATSVPPGQAACSEPLAPPSMVTLTIREERDLEVKIPYQSTRYTGKEDDIETSDDKALMASDSYCPRLRCSQDVLAFLGSPPF